jgi:hypothetical protein
VGRWSVTAIGRRVGRLEAQIVRAKPQGASPAI